ncbi:MAG: nicotinamide-nucleotide amidohydrolase family protein [Woeseiaceae bacterium]|nr:nicotinamide-nucleotide amidohydrolase family protein [Woeseiaceae bacterium]NIP21166.1 nicotinamide-nucleotide amidohydrolase family protein [Woeseiaceae bacterium]NIS90138.1 nicotinamide-nucleotide amidohydrolase family protein [Woeseiaceae bacterium]
MADHESIRKLAAALVNDMTEAGKAVSTAESCTGGWVAKAITDIPGSSAVFHYGVVSYSNGAKEHILGVKNETLEDHGSVSEAVVEEMARGVINLSGADIAVAVSGIAGPDGGTDEKPVGTVWFAWAVRDGGKIRTETSGEHFDGDRDLIRELTVVHALQGVLDRL